MKFSDPERQARHEQNLEWLRLAREEPGWLLSRLHHLAELEEQHEALVGVAGGVIWLDNNIHNYGSDEWRGFFKAVLRDARAAYPARRPSE